MCTWDVRVVGRPSFRDPRTADLAHPQPSVSLRDQPPLLHFWEDVEHYRKIGNQELLDKKEAKEQKRKNSRDKKEKKPNSKNIITINKDIMNQAENNYLLGSDSD